MSSVTNASSNTETSTAANSRLPWLRNPFFDLVTIAFAWVPFYLWVVFGLKLGGPIPKVAAERQEMMASLSLAIIIVLGLTYIHRHYTLLLVYGDKKIFAQRSKAFLISPLIIIGTLILAQYKIIPGSWVWVVVIGTLWNIWHTIMQRHGIFRVYGGKLGGGLESHEQGRRDLWMLWSLVAIMLCALIYFRPNTYTGIAETVTLVKVLQWLKIHQAYEATLALISLIGLGFIINWGRYEFRAYVSWRRHMPRWIFLFSTLCLLAIFIIHGLIVGFLCFGSAHALEYIAFVHLYGVGKYQKDSENHGLAARLFRSPLKTAPLLIGALLLAYYLLHDYRATPLYLVYYSSTSLLHFLYDGWIWKVRQSDVAKPLGIAAPRAL